MEKSGDFIMANIFDVSRLAGVSRSTVSRVLNNKGEVDVKTAERVWTAVKALNYHPNASARALVRHKTDMIGVLLADVTDPFYQKLVKGLESVTRPLNIEVVYYNTYENFENRKNGIFSMIHSGKVDGLTIVGSRLEELGIVLELLDYSLPVALIERDLPQKNVTSVISDNYHGARLAVEYLKGLGHTRIGCITGNMHFQTVIDRVEGFKDAMRRYSLPLPESYIVTGNGDHETGYLGMKRLLALTPRPTAVFACSDMMALGAIRAVNERGYTVPEDISVLGYGDLVFASMFYPQLTTIRQPFFQMGAIAALMLIDQIRTGKQADTFKKVLPAELVERKSCKALCNV
jgi:LacI family repressor for deo operon, udp, cdd, tsx, nupC, and nupG